MIGLLKHFDLYTIRARVFPALLAGLPTLALLVLMVPWDQFHISQAISGMMALVLLVAFADLARIRGRKIEAFLGTRATPHLWHRNDNAIDQISKDRYRTFMAATLKTPAPSADDELSNPANANQFYLSAGNWLRHNTRDSKKISILADELQTYGFRRNLLGLKPLALIMNVVVLGLCVLAMTLPLRTNLLVQQPPAHYLIAAVAALLHSLFMIFAVNKQSVREASFAYGVQLILSCETFLAWSGRPSNTRPKNPTRPRA